MIHEALYSRLSNFAGLGALVGTRIYPRMLPQDPAYPAVSWFKVSAPRESAMGSDPGLVHARFQVSSWGLTLLNTRDTAEQVRLALQRYRGTLAGTVIQDIFIENEDEIPAELVNGVLVFQIASDFVVHYIEP
jgi:hypothetical protein